MNKIQAVLVMAMIVDNTLNLVLGFSISVVGPRRLIGAIKWLEERDKLNTGWIFIVYSNAK